jgi:biotin synthase
LEDCGFCTQSAKHHANIERYYHKSIEQIVHEAQIADRNRALGFCLVTSGKGMDDKKLAFVAEAVHAIKKVVPDLNLIACNGLCSLEYMKELKKIGVFSYNHNLETSQAFYKTICTTHAWEERYQTCENAKSAGLALCSGGIYGLGESEADRESFLKAIVSLEPISTPINFFIANPSLPIQQNAVDKERAKAIIQKTRAALPQALVMIAGGREQVFGDDLQTLFESGANSVVVGDYLTTGGEKAAKDIAQIEALGYTISRECHAGG